ncbi:LANO_0B01750g1_1 [Lachancea nothofagi CBS 11611]|uniref:chitin synthase n=1 Tax=Lachancea nothofagi CBS 11611 TaxID=1266666 RepID=A0A1G4IVN3_9SACH|nr:LANO_0B01750g1_1 [Lachancea nothofagi CBS 11611]
MAADDEYYAFDNESLLRSRNSANGNLQRGESLVRRDRNDFTNPANPHHYYAQKAQQQRENGQVQVQESIPLEDMGRGKKKSAPTKEPPTSLSIWQVYCYIITFWAPAPLLSLFGMAKKERQFAWREKIALLSVIFYAGTIVAYLTFGFTKTVCGSQVLRLRNNEVSGSYLIINGKSYDLDSSSHPAAAGIESGTNVLYPPINAGGMDASFLFQNVNGNCKGLITPKDNCSIPYDNDEDLAWYFPCKLTAQDGSTKPNFTVSEYYDGWACHTSQDARDAYYSLDAAAEVYYTWDDIKNSTRNLVVYNGHVLDLDLLNWLQTDDLDYPSLFDQLRDAKLQGYDISLVLSDSFERSAARCLSEIIRVGEIDSSTIGCLASQVVLYISLVFILSVVFIKFFISCYFRWVVARKQGAYTVSNKTMNQHAKDIEDWSENINARGPIKKIDPSMRSGGQRRVSAFDLIRRNSMMLLNDKTDDPNDKFRGMTTMTTQSYLKPNPADPIQGTSAFQSPFTNDLISSSNNLETLDATIIHPDVVAQPPVDFMPTTYPLIHTICFVTCYSEDEQGLRTTLDSLATTDYPNSHKLIMVVCDGLIKGSGNDLTTPEIALSMVDDFVVPPEEVEPHSYVAVASGSKRHNMAKIYAGFYRYDNSSIEPELQQRVPMIVIVKCGTPDEQGSMKPGNRGKRDSQVILMSFLQRLTFEERMTVFEYQLLKNIWQITGLMADFYELVLMVDADTKVFPDSLTHMAAEMVKDPEIMGLCGETKIANKGESWVSWIQVFEYYISHHQAKAFESVFGSVTCLPGCFSIYRIKAPKGADGYWVPILANPDIVERYSDNDTGTLHKKNLLLLGEDRFLSSLMLRTFPKRKQVFLPKAACKTIVPNSFSVLLSQRRRWINSTVHNLMELVLIKDLCGSFCFSMQFVIGMELVGTLVLPLAICFTIYVIIFAIVSRPVPIITLVLLGVILGLPGLLIVVTASRWSYLGWMIIYIIALPIWNFVLPVYAYWKFDDFSWGDTRTIAGGNKSAAHDEEVGEFDHSKIRMRTWREFEKEERMKAKGQGQHSRLGSILNLDLMPEVSNSDRDDHRSF